MWYTQYIIMEHFNKSFFKFLFGFVGILALGIVGVLIVGSATMAEEEESLTAGSSIQ